MRLGGLAIKDAIDLNIWQAYKLNQKLTSNDLKIGPNSVDVTLSPSILSYDPYVKRIIDIYNEDTLKMASYYIHSHFTLFPNDFVLGCTCERFNCSEKYYDNFWTQHLDGRSTLGRLGIGIHVTAGFGDYGFQGRFTLEIFNVSNRPVKLYPFMRIGQISFEQVHQPFIYSGAYSSEKHFASPVEPQIGKERF